MAQPDVYTPAHSFVADSANIPDFPGQNLDVEFARLATVFAEYHTNLALIQRDDGALVNGIVTTDSLDTVLAAAIGDLASLAEVQALIDAAAASQLAAAASQTAAATSATGAASSASTATTQATNAAASAASAAATLAASALKANNLSDLANASTARTNLGLGGAAVLAVGTTTGTVAAGDDSRIVGAAQKSSNLSDLANASTARTNLGLGSAAVLTAGTGNNNAVQLDGSAKLPAVDGSQLTGISSGSPNLLINPRTDIDQRNAGVAATISDNSYWADRWRFIGEASASLTAKDTTIGGSRVNGLLKLTGTTDKGGVFQVIEGKNCKHLRSTAVVFSAVLQVSNTRLGNIKMGIAEFTGTEDSVSGDPVATWGADGVTPTLSASWAFLNTPANLNVTTSAVQYSVTATCGASTNNLAVIIWNDDKSYTANDTLYFTDAYLGRGSSAPTFEPRGIGDEFLRCLRYYEKKGGSANNQGFAYSAAIVSTSGAYYIMEFFPKRTAPALTFASASAYQLVSAAVLAGTALNSISSSQEAPTSAFITLTCAGTPWTAGQSGIFRDAGSSTGIVQISAEL